LYESEAEDAEIRLVDFGFARMKPASRGLTTPCFTLYYAAPEVLQHALKSTSETTAIEYDESCDLWSLGVVLVQACVFVVDNIANCNFSFSFKYCSKFYWTRFVSQKSEVVIVFFLNLWSESKL